MSKEPKSAVIRVRVHPALKAQLEALAREHRVDMSDLVREALLSRYGEHLEAPAPLREDPAEYTTSLALAIQAQTFAIRELISTLRPEPSSGKAFKKPA